MTHSLCIFVTLAGLARTHLTLAPFKVEEAVGGSHLVDIVLMHCFLNFLLLMLTLNTPLG